jgi:hypothetical protein
LQNERESKPDLYEEARRENEAKLKQETQNNNALEAKTIQRSVRNFDPFEKKRRIAIA